MLEVRRLSRANEAFSRVVDDDVVAVDDENADDLEAEDGISDGPMVRLVNSIIFQAAEEGASDVHFEPQEDAVVVRFRVDGVLQITQRVPRKLASGVVTRLKVLAKLDIAERRKPQDGRISLDAGAAGRLLDIRVATLPTVEGESVVMRLLDKSRTRADARGARAARRTMREQFCDDRQAADRRAARHRADRLGQVDDALRGARRAQPPGDQRDHRRGPGRVPAGRRRARSRSTIAPASPSRPRCARSCVPTPTSSWSARSATSRRPRSRSKRR